MCFNLVADDDDNVMISLSVSSCRFLKQLNANTEFTRLHPFGPIPVPARLLGLGFRIPPRVMDVFCKYCVLSGRGLFVELITRPEDSYQV